MMILHDKPGQMCNRIWSQVHFIALSMQAGNRVLIPFFGDYAHFFEDLTVNPSAVFIRTHGRFYDFVWLNFFRALRCVPKVLLSLFHVYVDSRHWYAENWPLKILRGKRNLVFFSGWNHPKPDLWLLNCLGAIRKLYQPARQTVEKVDSFLATQKSIFDVIVGVHIRRGDYKDFCGGAYFYSDEVYTSYIRQFVNDPQFKDKKIGFLLCSNDALDPAAFHGLPTFSMPAARSMDDLYALSCCDYLLGPPSSFSMWASFYGQVPLRILKYASESLDELPFSPIIALDRFLDGRVFEHVDSQGAKPPETSVPQYS